MITKLSKGGSCVILVVCLTLELSLFRTWIIQTPSQLTISFHSAVCPDMLTSQSYHSDFMSSELEVKVDINEPNLLDKYDVLHNFSVYIDTLLNDDYYSAIYQESIGVFCYRVLRFQ